MLKEKIHARGNHRESRLLVGWRLVVGVAQVVDVAIEVGVGHHLNERGETLS